MMWISCQEIGKEKFIETGKSIYLRPYFYVLEYNPPGLYSNIKTVKILVQKLLQVFGERVIELVANLFFLTYNFSLYSIFKF